MRGRLGHEVADTVMLEAHFGMPDPTKLELAASTVAAAQRLFGNAAANTTRAAFVARGILD